MQNSKILKVFGNDSISPQEYLDMILFNVQVDWATIIGNSKKVNNMLNFDIKSYLNDVKSFIEQNELTLKENTNFMGFFGSKSTELSRAVELSGLDGFVKSAMYIFESITTLSVKSFLNLTAVDTKIIDMYQKEEERILKSYYSLSKKHVEDIKDIFSTARKDFSVSEKIEYFSKLKTKYEEALSYNEEHQKKYEQNGWKNYNRLSDNGKIYIDIEQVITKLALANKDVIASSVVNLKTVINETNNQLTTINNNLLIISKEEEKIINLDVNFTRSPNTNKKLKVRNK